MTEFATLQLLGWLAVGAVMFLLAATAGFDFGAGILLPYLGRNDLERRAVINTVGPTWDGNQVWLIIAGGAIFAIWPRVYAAAFSGFYFAMMLVLWALFLRPVAFEYRSKMKSAAWRSFWDWALFIGSLVPALILGVGLGNALIGVPFHYNPMSVRFFYDGTFWGLLRGFPLLCGVVSLAMMCLHGAAYVGLRTIGVINQRANRAMQVCAWVYIAGFLAAGVWVLSGLAGFRVLASTPNATINNVLMISHGLARNYSLHPWFIAPPILAFVSALAVIFFARRANNAGAFWASVCVPAFTIATAGLSMYPVILPSNTQPQDSLIIWNASSSLISLLGILTTALIALPVIFVYTAFVYKKLWGRGRRLNEEVVAKEDHLLY
ncbi:MAG: cytochrome d ubiquinol oxidase subunit II [Gammaproteobacteria bacterium CG11_big_fil_rev_8_21_14_0_20_46_22]|nr:MAG: cytochrome d ubiquinol oxidase subunit II [Gammaproteobacteria bacterium CG12_big_fil_rev_8_21_14_0_65_46_12]PIR11271.1 MAG: cytochrome d ubiquinol oxidase subunit II [Gammaproteobacteria bacterium CG11_big_fil_rev_8_21_14_0_20_46_22]